MTYSQQPGTSRRLIGFAAVALFHVGVLYLFISGIGQRMAHTVEAPLMAQIIVPRLPPPPPPRQPHVVPRVVKAPPPPFVPPPEVKVAPPPAPTAIQVTTAVKPTHAIDPTPAPPRPEPVVPDTDVSEQSISGPSLQYPQAMVDLGVEGSADISCEVGTDGRTSNCSVLSTHGDASFGEAALQHAAEARFRPATHDGKPIASRHRWHVVFKLSE